jgi:nitrite reductase/ring-hydroxylating ferredoxin subunit
MADFIKVAEVQEIPAGSAKMVRLGRQSVALFNISGTIHAINNICPHEGGPLCEGTLDGCVVVCPWHGIPFDVRTGRSTSDEGFEVSVFETKIEGTEIFLKVT